MMGRLGETSAAAVLRTGMWPAPMAERSTVRGGRPSMGGVRFQADRDVGVAAGEADFVRVAAAAAIGLNALLPLIELGRVVLTSEIYGFPSNPLAAVLATALSMPLHLRHVLYAVRGERAPAAAWSLAALLGVNAVAAFIVGPGWMMNFALLALSVLIVVPAPWSLPLYAATVLAAAPIVNTPAMRADALAGWTGVYLVFSVAWRSVTLFVLVWLVAAFRRLDEARRELRDRAVVRERLRIQTELRRDLGGALERIVSRAAAAEHDPVRAVGHLRSLVGESRQTLADARRLIAGYQAVSVRSELDAAVTLLGAAGIEPRVVVADARALDAIDGLSCAAVRAVVVKALHDESLASCVIRVGCENGQLQVSMLPVDEPERRRRPVAP